MPFEEQDSFFGPLAMPKGLDIRPEAQREASPWDVIGAAFRTENPVVSAVSSYDYDPLKPFDPDYRPWDDIQGTRYEQYGDRFSGARDREDVLAMQAQIDQELEDRRTLDAAGVPGVISQMGAALMSPTSILPGGMLVRGAKGVSIARTGLTVAGSNALAAAMDEAMLQGTQQTRSTSESAMAIGGSFLLGGILGAAAGKMAKGQFKAAALQAEDSVRITREFDDALRSVGAADTTQDLRLRREQVFQTINSIPLLRGMVRSDPILRAQLSDNRVAREVIADLAETPLQYAMNDEGQAVRSGVAPVEARIRDRERTELAASLSHLHRSFAEYSKDGPTGTLGTLTAPITRRYLNLVGKDQKLTAREFMDEVGKAMRRGDKHPIPQVQSAADALRQNIFDKIKDEAIEVGIFDPDLQVKNADSYFTRVYDLERIRQNFGNGSENDIAVVLREEFKKRRAQAQEFLAFNREADELEVAKWQRTEQIRTARSSLKKATKRAQEKRTRAEAAVGRAEATSRTSATLRRAFEQRAAGLRDGIVEGPELEALKDSLREARGAARLEPMSLLGAIRKLGGLKDERTGGRWAGKSGWTKDAKATEIENILGSSAVTIRRKDGMDPDDMRELLVERGYLAEGGTVDDLYEAIRRESAGEKVYSEDDALDLERFESAMEFRNALEEAGIDYTKPVDEIIKGIPGKAPNQSRQKGKAGEAERSGKKAEAQEGGAEARVLKALDRLDDARARLEDLKGEIGPKVREEITAAQEDLKRIMPELKKAKKVQAAEEFFAGSDDLGIAASVNDTVTALLGLKVGENFADPVFASPTRARVLDVADEVLEPWLVSNAEDILSQYFRNMVPDLELARKFGGDVQLNFAFEKMNEEALRQVGVDPATVDRGTLRNLTDDALSKLGVDMKRKRNRAIFEELQARREDLSGVRDRLRGRYGVPANPRSGWIQANRTLRTLSYTGFLGGMMVSAVPDLAGIVGRAGVGALGAGLTGLMEPKRLGLAVKDMAELGAAAEWYLNSRAMAIGEVFDPYGQGTRLERTLGQGARHFSIATGMIPWNIGWKSVGGAMVASKMSKAADAVKSGKATKKQLRTLAENGIEPWMASRIADQIEQFGDKNGTLWLPRGQEWQDQEAFEAFRRAMNREFDLMVITPGQDMPLAFGSETGKFFLQFKSFAFSSHHRILLSGIQRADADVLAQFTTAIVLGGLAANLKAELGGYEKKEGVAFWEDAVERSGLAGWLMEPYNMAGALTGGMTSISGEEVSRYKARSETEGLLGPSVDMAFGMVEGINGIASGEASYRDIRKLMRPIPGNNLWYILPLMQKVEDASASAFGAEPRER